MSNQELSEKLHKPINRKFEKRKVYLSFIDIWGTDLADMHLISIIKEFVFYYVLLIFSVNMHGLFLWKIKKGITITDAFQNILDESNRESKEMWVDKGNGQ